jgi:hypothetical protein
MAVIGMIQFQNKPYPQPRSPDRITADLLEPRVQSSPGFQPHFADFCFAEVIAFLYLPNTSSRIMVLGLTQPLSEMSVRYPFGGKVRLVRLRADCLDNVGSSTFHNPIGLQGLLRG